MLANILAYHPETKTVTKSLLVWPNQTGLLKAIAEVYTDDNPNILLEIKFTTDTPSEENTTQIP